jgi:hypothetical protein
MLKVTQIRDVFFVIQFHLAFRVQGLGLGFALVTGPVCSGFWVYRPGFRVCNVGLLHMVPVSMLSDAVQVARHVLFACFLS